MHPRTVIGHIHSRFTLIHAYNHTVPRIRSRIREKYYNYYKISVRHIEIVSVTFVSKAYLSSGKLPTDRKRLTVSFPVKVDSDSQNESKPNSAASFVLAPQLILHSAGWAGPGPLGGAPARVRIGRPARRDGWAGHLGWAGRGEARRGEVAATPTPTRSDLDPTRGPRIEQTDEGEAEPGGAGVGETNC